MKIGVVCEGGGMRGIYTAGVLESWLDKNFMADYVVGVSAGASTSISYVSKQNGRLKRTYMDYCRDKRYVSIQSYIKTGSLFGMDFIFSDIPEKLDPFDYEAFNNNHCEFYAGATDLQSGEIVYFGKKDIKPKFTVIRASCSIPVFSPAVEVGGKKYYDGGVADSIPIDKALQDGCDKLLVILTRPRSYVKKPMSFGGFFKAKFKDNPAFVQQLLNRHNKYNETNAKINMLERQGKAIIIAPELPLVVGRMSKNLNKLASAYSTGYADGGKVYSEFSAW